MSGPSAPLDLERFLEAPRWLLEAPLAPLQGARFQPTGFPDMGPALYVDPDGRERLLVESPQSMANHLEATVWDAARGRPRRELEGLSYVRLRAPDGRLLTSTWLEPHRLGSPRILDAGDLGARVAEATAGPRAGAVDPRALPPALFALDVGSLVHGVFLQSLAGALKVPRALGAFIEAIDVRPAAFGGVKRDPVDPSGPARDGLGQVVFHREDFVAGSIRLYASLDVAQIAGYGLAPDETRLVLALALYELRALLDRPLRLRSRCDLGLAGPLAPAPPDLGLPTAAELLAALPRLIEACPRMEVTELVAEERGRA